MALRRVCGHRVSAECWGGGRSCGCAPRPCTAGPTPGRGPIPRGARHRCCPPRGRAGPCAGSEGRRGVSSSQSSHDEIRSRLAYVEQDTPVVPGTIRDNLLLARPGTTDEELRRVLHEVRPAEKVDALDEGLDTPLSGAAVSGGERQRIALARAQMRTPDVLLLDEATAQLDGLTEAAVQTRVRARAATGAVVTIAHRLSTVIDADTIVVTEAGRVRARGGHAELLATDALYQELVEALSITADTQAV
ncbi:ATP-binding cassette domain-containing protein [Streptomyces massasporeus]|uniref:ATP-binding cassette domain-containing protein n=1 Tax=Streptomyces massasporeus TaxID=67324 RepID=UPI0036929298